MTRVNIIKLNAKAILPEYQTFQASGMDLHACINEPKILQSMERAIIPTGLAIELPSGLEAQIRARSGLSIKYGITMINGIGTIDSDYRGEIGLLIVNLGNEPFVVEPDMRIAQMVISNYERIIWNETKSLNQTQRSDGAYGSTGIDSSVDTAV